MKIPKLPPSVDARGYDDGDCGATITCLSQREEMSVLEQALWISIRTNSREGLENAIASARTSFARLLDGTYDPWPI